MGIAINKADNIKIKLALEKSTPLFILLGVITATLFLISPFYEVPQNDDWSYFLTLQIWFETGVLQHIGWNDPVFLAQAVWGGLFAKIFGLSFSTLRISTLVLSVIGCLAFYRMARQQAVEPWLCTALCLLLFFNPLYLTLSYSFNTDIPYTVLILIGVMLFVGGIGSNKGLSFYLTVGIVFALAYLVRQLALVPLFCIVFYLMCGKHCISCNWQEKIKKILVITLPTVCGAIIYTYWKNNYGYLGLQPVASNWVLLNLSLTSTEVIKIIANATLLCFGLLFNVAIFFSPLVILIIKNKAIFKSKIFYSCIFINIIAVYFLHKFLGFTGWPYLGTYLTANGTLPLWWSNTTIITPVMGVGLAFVSVFNTAVLFYLLSGIAINNYKNKTMDVYLLFSLICILPLLISSTVESVYDRYIIPSLPFLLLILVKDIKLGSKHFAFNLCLFICIFVGFEWHRAYTDRAINTWYAAQQLAQTGVKPEQVFVGFEWEGFYMYRQALEVHGLRPPYSLDNGMPWRDWLDHRCVVREENAINRVNNYRQFFGFNQFQIVGICE